MDYVSPIFEKRLRGIVRRHRRMQHGVVHRVDRNGLIVARPRIYKPQFPLAGLLMLVATWFVFKSILLAHMGEVTFAERVEALSEGSIVEQAGAWVMQADVVTVFGAQLLSQAGLF